MLCVAGIRSICQHSRLQQGFTGLSQLQTNEFWLPKFIFYARYTQCRGKKKFFCIIFFTLELASCTTLEVEKNRFPPPPFFFLVFFCFAFPEPKPKRRPLSPVPFYLTRFQMVTTAANPGAAAVAAISANRVTTAACWEAGTPPMAPPRAPPTVAFTLTTDW